MLDYTTQFAAPPQGQVFDSNPSYQEHKYKHSYSQQKPYKKKSFLSDLFDFD
jgi:Zn-finger nucleic acid-binding protein